MIANAKLAIIIPAYKADYFDETLRSLANQTRKDFNVYIGNDDGDPRIDQIVGKYKEALNIRYQRFDSNFGANNLVAQWRRTLAMMQGEDFFIFFSDDDIMESECVSSFHREISLNPNHDVYHFNIAIINAQSQKTKQPKPFRKTLSAIDFYIHNNILRDICARMPEFVFNTRAFNAAGGFVEFPLAMRTDNATVMNVANEKGIGTIEGPMILWRRSGINVATSIGNRSKHLKLLEGEAQFDNWLAPRFFPSLTLRLMWLRRLVLVKYFANPRLNVTMDERKNIILKSEDISRHVYLTHLIRPMKSLLSLYYQRKNK